MQRGESAFSETEIRYQQILTKCFSETHSTLSPKAQVRVTAWDCVRIPATILMQLGNAGLQRPGARETSRRTVGRSGRSRQ
jgi:hypothetical protein